MDTCMQKCTDKWMQACMDAWKQKWMTDDTRRWMDGWWMYGQVNGEMNRRTDGSECIYKRTGFIWKVRRQNLVNGDKRRNERLLTICVTSCGPQEAMFFPVVMYRCESWIIKKAECQRINAFKLWCWRRFLTVILSARRSNQSILKEIKPDYSLEGLMLELKLQHFGYLMWRTDSLEKTLMLGKIESRRRRRQQRMQWLDGIIDTMDMSLSKLREMVKDREAWRAIVHGVTKSQTRPSDWTTRACQVPGLFSILGTLGEQNKMRLA